MNAQEMPTRYDATQKESHWYACWEEAGLFSPDPNPEKPRFTITIPPPNLTGSLHMGHALCYPIQDMIGRFERLRGKSVLILPGQDHAGIATQTVVDKQLRKEGSSALQLGRDAFIERVWDWRRESGDTILRQFRALGCAFDWSRSRFTLDEHYADAVLRVFIDWYERGLIFRGKRVVNWDPILKTNVSDIETERKAAKGKLYHVRYRFADGTGEIIIATTRPETILADVAVAVHPSDERYKDIIGRKLIVPLVNREVPLIADMYPDPEFGTGAVKITPAHDANDYEVGVRHQLAMPVILDESARINLDEVRPVPEALESLQGLDRFRARDAVVEMLEAADLLVRTEDHDVQLVISDRSKEIIEPLLSEQWFVDQAALAKPVIEAVRNGEITFTPDRYTKLLLDWLENIRPWNISRQLWWGHRVPIYTTESGRQIAALNPEDAARRAAPERVISQDPDVLDTWFSSGLWPFATLGWPDETPDLQNYYPTDVLVTDRNIINLWVARMLMMGYDQAGAKPFSHVVIHATVLRRDGARMSKSLGTGIDPMDVIEKFGADALRWALLGQSGQNQELRYLEEKPEEARNFANKIWNATRFVLMNVAEMPPEPRDLNPVDRWLLSRLAETETTVRTAYEQYDPQTACQTLYRFFWNDLCDWYIEVSKSRLADESTRQTPQWVLLTAIEAFLVMLHPVMPHLTEELYAYLPLPEKSPFIMSHRWPTIPETWHDRDAHAEIERVFEITRALRALRASVDLPAGTKIPLAGFTGELGENGSIVSSQAWVETLQAGRPEGKVVSTHAAGVDLYILLDGLVDVEKQRIRIERDLAKLADERAKLEKRLNDPQFVERAKPEVIERDRAAKAELDAKQARLEDRARLFSEA
ncbi:MAG: valine--tRNA ligase [Fimbriimonadaceae bacterium]|nr:valine--tRNA ligase [Fimbriimonadaceae bacterium]